MMADDAETLVRHHMTHHFQQFWGGVLKPTTKTALWELKICSMC